MELLGWLNAASPLIMQPAADTDAAGSFLISHAALSRFDRSDEEEGAAQARPALTSPAISFDLTAKKGEKSSRYGWGWLNAAPSLVTQPDDGSSFISPAAAGGPSHPSATSAGGGPSRPSTSAGGGPSRPSTSAGGGLSRPSTTTTAAGPSLLSTTRAGGGLTRPSTTAGGGSSHQLLQQEEVPHLTHLLLPKLAILLLLLLMPHKTKMAILLLLLLPKMKTAFVLLSKRKMDLLLQPNMKMAILLRLNPGSIRLTSARPAVPSAPGCKR